MISICAILGRRQFRHVLTIGVIAALSAVTLKLPGSVSRRPTTGCLLLPCDPRNGNRIHAGMCWTADRWARIPASIARALDGAGFSAILPARPAYSTEPYIRGVRGCLACSWCCDPDRGCVFKTIAPGTFLQRPFMQYGVKSPMPGISGIG